MRSCHRAASKVSLAWGSFVPTSFAAASPASPVQLWDTRSARSAGPAGIMPSEPALSSLRRYARFSMDCRFASAASLGATLVRWSRVHPFRFASVHDGSIRVWDARVRLGTTVDSQVHRLMLFASQTNSMVWSVSAHKSTVSDLDWHPVRVGPSCSEFLFMFSAQSSFVGACRFSQDDQFVTCAEDQQVKFWKLSTTDCQYECADRSPRSHSLLILRCCSSLQTRAAVRRLRYSVLNGIAAL